MGDMQQPGGGQPSDGVPMGLRNPMERNRSVLNPRDAAYMKKSGQISQNMTVADFVQNVLKTPLDAPFPQLIVNLRKLAENKDSLGKARNIAAEAGGPPATGGPRGVPENPMPQGRKPAVSEGLSGLMAGMGG